MPSVVASGTFVRDPQSKVSANRALAIRPDFADMHNKFCAVLNGLPYMRRYAEHMGRYAELWRGAEELSGRTILLSNDYGHGDMLQFVRYAPLLAARGARVVLEVQPPLKVLMTGLAGVDVTVARGEELPAFDYLCPLPRLPLAFATTLQSIPVEIPYLQAAADRVTKWQALLGERTGPRVGLVWSGNRNHRNDHNRSIALARLLPLLAVPGVRLVSLQKELRDEDAEVLRNLSGFPYIGDQLDDFADTAAVVSLLDLVISVDSAVAHLAGALGKPVWVLLPFSPDLRWLLECEDSPWYPSARLFRQPQTGDWDSVIGRVREELEDDVRRCQGAKRC